MEIRSLDQQDKRSICSWQYPEPYGVYNLPAWEEMQRQGIGFANPLKARNFYGFWEDHALIGFVHLMEEDAGVFVGIGVEPSRCGQHKGSAILRQAVQLAGRLYPGKRPYLEVRTWNQRAIRCYQRAGFQIDGEPFQQVTGAGTGTFYRMIYTGMPE